MILLSSLADRYRIERELGAGGMATVYLAHDLRHDRQVALKVLRPELAAVIGADRFLAEIKTTANLQHPHILPLFDSGTVGGTVYYAMPYVGGESLRDRLNREKQLPVDEAVRIATEIASALDYAHRHGVIHRDIKPENILLHDGSALVADFGIALAASRTEGSIRMTETGMSLGTPTYMSPEQALGERTLDARSDIYALGCVLYEMLAGQAPFIGPTAQAVLARVMTSEPESLTALRRTVPAHVAHAVHTAIQKLPADRFKDARAFMDALRDQRFTATLPVPARAGLAKRWLIAAGALGVIAVASALISWPQSSRNALPLLQATLDIDVAHPDFTRFAVTGDGSLFALTTQDGIVLRKANERTTTLLPGTQFAESPAFSPDGKWVAFHQGGRLRKMAVTGGSALALITSDSVRGNYVHWGADGTIAFESATSIYVLPPGAAAPRRLPDAYGQAPRLMPDGTGVFYVDLRTGSKLIFYDLRKHTQRVVLEESSEAQYVSTGHLVFAHPAGGIFAARYNKRTATIEGAPVPIVADFLPSGSNAPFQVTSNGMLLYRVGVDPASRLMVGPFNAKLDTLPLEAAVVSYARFSPDGGALAVTVGSARGTNRYTAIYDFALGTFNRFTLEGGGHSPAWSPDGRFLAFTAESQGSDGEDLFVQPIDRSAPPRRILRIPDDQHAFAWPMDSVIIFGIVGSARAVAAAMSQSGDVWVTNPMAASPRERPYLNAQWSEYDVSVSPDMKWAAYVSNESGRTEIYVRPFPDARTGGQWKISSEGALSAQWSADGRTIYYQNIDRDAIHSVRVDPGPPFKVLGAGPTMRIPDLGPAWNVDRRSGRLLVTQLVSTFQPRIGLVLNWQDRLKPAQ